MSIVNPCDNGKIFVVDNAKDLDRDFFALIKKARLDSGIKENEAYSEEIAKLPGWESMTQEQVSEELKDTPFVDDVHENLARLEVIVNRMVAKRENKLRKDDIVDLYFAGVMKHMVLDYGLFAKHITDFKDINRGISEAHEKGPQSEFNFCLCNGEYILAMNSFIDPRFDGYGDFTDQAKGQLGRGELLYSMASTALKCVDGGRTRFSDALESIHFNGLEKYAKLLSYITLFRKQEDEKRFSAAIVSEVDSLTKSTDFNALSDDMLTLYSSYNKEMDILKRMDLRDKMVSVERRIQTIKPDYKFTPIHK